MRERSREETVHARRIGAVDIGGSKIAVGIVSADGQILGRTECATLPEKGFADAMERIERMLSELGARRDGLAGIGVGCPGPLDPWCGKLLDVGTLPGWNGYELAAELRSRFDVDVAVENDADAAALAEFAWGAGAKSSRFIYVTVSTGIGGGIVIDGTLYRGSNDAHPELGHQVLDASGPSCYCGAKGCWESLASGHAMSAWMQATYPELGPVSAATICERASLGDHAALRAMQRQGYYLGLGLANIITLFAPDKIALGGGVMKSGALFLPEAMQVVATICTQVPAAITAIEYATLGDDVGLLGAAQCWLQRFG